MLIDKLIKFLKLLPNYDELNQFNTNEDDINYIFQQITNVTTKILEKYDNCSNKETDQQYSKFMDMIEEPYFLIECLTERLWERINIGHFSEVSINIRKSYAAANYFKIVFLMFISNSQKSESCSECLDQAILIGYTENLYSNNKMFLVQIEEYLNSKLETKNFNLKYIDPIPFEDYECDIPFLDAPEIEYFKENYLNLQKPVLIRNTIKNWPALKKWRDPNYLLKLAGNRKVPIEIGLNYSSDEWSQQLLKLKDFLERNFGVNSKPSPDEVEYLAQHELFDQVPKLKEDIKIPEYCIFENAESDIDIKAWLGPEGTISPLHFDPKHNVLCQVFGKKKIILASPEDTINLYPNDKGFFQNTSQLNAENIDFDKFPLAKNVKFYELTLQESECLYLPPKWWHFVKSLSKSFSVSFWWNP